MKRTCISKKIGYDTQTEAKRIAKKMEVEYHNMYDTYLCGSCNKYHVRHRVSKRLREHFLNKFVTRETVV